MPRGGLGAATLGLFGGMFALEIAYAVYVTKIRHVFDESKIDELKKLDSKNKIDLSLQKKFIPSSPPASLVETINPEIKTEKPSVETSSKTVYSTDMDSTSNVHISIIINTPKPSSDGPPKNVSCTKNEDEFKDIKQETYSINTVNEEKNDDFLSSEKLREILIGSSNTQEHRINIKDENKRSAFNTEDDMFVPEEPFRLDNKMKTDEKYNFSAPDNNVYNSRRLDHNTAVTLKCNPMDKVEVIAVTTPPNDVKRKWYTNTPLLPPK